MALEEALFLGVPSLEDVESRALVLSIFRLPSPSQVPFPLQIHKAEWSEGMEGSEF